MDGGKLQSGQEMFHIILGLDKVPQFLSDTLKLPQTSPDISAQSTVLVQGGYDPCLYDKVVTMFIIMDTYNY